MYKTLIIEDEIDAQMLLSKILEENHPDIELRGIADSISQALNALESNEIDLLFVDIELKDGNAFDLLSQIDFRNYKIIFTTAYENFAIDAFKYHAVDYLLKPYSPSMVSDALSKLKSTKLDQNLIKELRSVMSQAQTGAIKKIKIPTSDGVHFFVLEEILHVEADRSYSKIYLSTGEKKLLSKPLKEIENLLDSNVFFRTHASHLVNLNHVKRIANQDGGYAELVDGSQIPIARRRRQDFLDAI